jgi:hypothetical protein
VTLRDWKLTSALFGIDIVGFGDEGVAGELPPITPRCRSLCRTARRTALRRISRHSRQVIVFSFGSCLLLNTHVARASRVIRSNCSMWAIRSSAHQLRPVTNFQLPHLAVDDLEVFGQPHVRQLVGVMVAGLCSKRSLVLVALLVSGGSASAVPGCAVAGRSRRCGAALVPAACAPSLSISSPVPDPVGSSLLPVA